MSTSRFLHHDLSSPLPAEVAGGVVAIGNFDGVHRGHQSVLRQALELARSNSLPCYALSFEPHPRTLFKPESPVFRLTDEGMKARVLAAMGLDGLLVLPFTRELASMEAADFMEDLLASRARASHLVSGFNFHFGRNRAGTPEFMQEKGAELGLGVTIVDAFADPHGETLSSSRVRRCLGVGDVEAAAQILGYRWTVSGTVKKGAQIGRTLGFPTANISLAENCRLRHGIYAVRLRREDGSLHDGVASFGRRPTFDNGAPLLETFVFDFSDNLYGEQIEVILFEWLRGEEAFDSAEALTTQMHRDADRARKVLGEVEPKSDLDGRLAFDQVQGE